MTPDLSISIINTNNREQTLQCLRSLFANTHRVSLEVFVVDNACTDGSADAIAAEFPQVKLIRNAQKLGFSTNNNKALSQASGRYLCILNDDTIVQDGAFDALVTFMDVHPEAGACGPKLLNPDGSEQQSFDYFLMPMQEAFRPLSLWRRQLALNGDTPREVDRVIGACMVVRRQATEQVGLLDPAFDPIYTEETDWCYRIRQRGWRIYAVPNARVIHYGGQTMNRVRRAALERLYRNKTLFFRKHHGQFSAWLFKIFLMLSSIGKLLVWSVLLTRPAHRGRARDELSAHWQVCQCALFL
jgi:GT2 family glycosyltransferase